MDGWGVAREEDLVAERDLAAVRGEQYAQVIDIGPGWDVGAPLPHLIASGSRRFVAVFAVEPSRNRWMVLSGLVGRRRPRRRPGSGGRW